MDPRIHQVRKSLIYAQCCADTGGTMLRNLRHCLCPSSLQLKTQDKQKQSIKCVKYHAEKTRGHKRACNLAGSERKGADRGRLHPRKHVCAEV